MHEEKGERERESARRKRDGERERERERERKPETLTAKPLFSLVRHMRHESIHELTAGVDHAPQGADVEDACIAKY